MTNKMRSHYLIRMKNPVLGKDWVLFADAVEAFFTSKGFDAWGINNHEIDRDLMLLKDNLDGIEGTVMHLVTEDDLVQAAQEILNTFNYEYKSIFFNDHESKNDKHYS
jgi:hypothetical protein